MGLDIELYRGSESEYFGNQDFRDVLRKAASRALGEEATRGRIRFEVDGPAGPAPFPGPPEVHNLESSHGSCTVWVTRDGETVQERRLRVVDLLGPVLAEELGSAHPDVESWSFRLRQTTITALIVVGAAGLEHAHEERPTPEVEGSVDVDPAARRHQPFTLTPLARADEETVAPETLGLDAARLGRINILMSQEIHDGFLTEMSLSRRMEEGGFLLGRARRTGQDAHLVEITHVTPAHRSGAGVVHFTFTGESFLAVAQLIEERGRSEELVGWYHTHLFNVEFSMGLSSVDVDLHMATFRRPWQVAALINMTSRGRVLRFYGRDDGELREYEQWISDDSGRYRAVGPAVGGE